MGKELFSDKEKQKISQKLFEKNVKTQCPMCGHNKFILTDGYFNHSVQANTNNISIGGPSVPTIAIICSNCGFVSQHAIGILGLLDNEKRR
jgi:predicted RNA-binding Zn-ribbon protein involved in translation (DUF1610 family)